jgi:hypothetical protein
VKNKMQTTQRNKIRDLFTARPNEWIPLFIIFPLAAQYNARILELRKSGMQIENKTKKVDGVKHSWYKYIPNNIQKELF